MDAKGTIRLLTQDSTYTLEIPILDMGLNPGGFWVKGAITGVPGHLSGRLYQLREVYDEEGDLAWSSLEDFRVPIMKEGDTLTIAVRARFNSVDGGPIPLEATDENIVATIEVAQRILKDTA